MFHFTLRELHEHFGDKRRLAILMGVVAICVLSGPFQTLQYLSVVERVLYWSFTVLGASVLSHLSFACVLKLLDGKSYHLMIKLLICNVVSGLLIGTFIYIVVHSIWGGDNKAGGLLMLIGIAFVVSVFISLIICFSGAYDEDGVKVEQGGESNALFERLPKELGRNLISISSQDHYLEVSTTKGKELILMRLSDAIQALPADSGLQIHRSHWVAKSAITELSKEGGKWELVLKNDTRLPVSRNYRDDVKLLGL